MNITERLCLQESMNIYEGKKTTIDEDKLTKIIIFVNIAIHEDTDAIKHFYVIRHILV